MAKNRMTFEKHQRDAKKKRKAEEKRAMKQKKKEQPVVEIDQEVDQDAESPSVDGSIES